MFCKSFLPVIFAGMFLIFNSCATTTYHDVYPLLADGKYDSEFPYRGCSEQLEQIAETVRMINCLVFYKSQIFSKEQKVRLSDFHDPNMTSKVAKEVYLNRTSAGSCTVIYFQDRKIAVMTSQHIVDFPDTIITYYADENTQPTEFIQSIAVKERQKNYIATIQGAGNLEILASDKANDLAILGQKIDGPSATKIPVFSYPIGKARELEWGAFVYLFGYPEGYRIITKGIVSNPNRDKNGTFLTDGVFNKGFSGGIVLAIRDGIPNFELVGMVKMVPGYQEYYLAPGKEGVPANYDLQTAYTGISYVDSRTEIIYGVSPTIPIELIVRFFEENEKQLIKKGYFLSSFYRSQFP
ncbi:MAG: serine protease [Bacteroidota bacterium]